VKASIVGGNERRRFWDDVFDRRVADHVLAGRDAEAQRAPRTRAQRPAAQRRGSVALVGAGPGDADLLTLRALRLLRTPTSSSTTAS
jgi:uroporphyrin-III C-methyltransferase/precorrin-2 dehydrogenase/sirohydrochlorin ferrochelatase